MGFYKNDATPANNTSVNGIAIQGGSSPANIDNALRELSAQGKQFVLDISGATTVGGTADAITIAANDTAANAYFDGMMVGFVAGSDNTSTAPTANVNLIGAKVIKKAPASTAAETALAAGDIQAGGLYLLRYRSAWASAAGAWQLIDLQHGIPIGDVDLSGNKLILDADDDSWLQSTADDYWLWKAGNQTIAEHGWNGSNAYHFFYGQTNLHITKFAYSALTISSGAVTATRSHHSIYTEGEASTDDLITINGGVDGMFLFLRPTSGSKTVVIKGGGNIFLQDSRPIVLDEYRDVAAFWSDGTYWYEMFRPDKWNYEAAVATTSGATIDITGLAGAKEIEIMFNGVSGNSTGQMQVQIGDSGGIEATGYTSNSNDISGGSSSTIGFCLRTVAAANSVTGIMKLRNYSGNKWIADHMVSRETLYSVWGTGIKELSASLDRLRLAWSGADNFDAGEVIVRWR